MLRKFALAAAVASLGLTLVATAVTEASARPGGGQGRGFSGGARMGGGPSFRGFAGRSGFASPRAFINPGVRFSNPGFRRHYGGGFRRYGPAFVGGLGLGAYGYYNSGYDECIVPQNVLTPYGWQLTYVNVCNDYY
jgi:hypothetical protein